MFGTSPNSLTSVQQQELAVRAGALAAGFLAAPLVTEIQRDIGLDILEISPSGDTGGGPKVTLGDEVLVSGRGVAIQVGAAGLEKMKPAELSDLVKSWQ